MCEILSSCKLSGLSDRVDICSRYKKPLREKKLAYQWLSPKLVSFAFWCDSNYFFQQVTEKHSPQVKLKKMQIVRDAAQCFSHCTFYEVPAKIFTSAANVRDNCTSG